MQGVKIVMDEEKMLRNGLNPSEIYAKIDEFAKNNNLNKQDKHHYMGNDDDKDFSNVAIFACIHLLHYKDFTKNVKEWYWLKNENIDSDLIKHYKNKQEGVWE